MTPSDSELLNKVTKYFEHLESCDINVEAVMPTRECSCGLYRALENLQSRLSAPPGYTPSDNHQIHTDVMQRMNIAPPGEGHDDNGKPISIWSSFHKKVMQQDAAPSHHSGAAVDQKAVYEWAVSTFGEHATKKEERAARLLEEAIEVCQAVGLPYHIAERLIVRVYSRPVGEVPREIGGVHLTLLVLAECLGISANDEGAREFDRVRSLPAEHFRRKVAEKEAAGIENISRHPSSTGAEE